MILRTKRPQVFFFQYRTKTAAVLPCFKWHFFFSKCVSSCLITFGIWAFFTMSNTSRQIDDFLFSYAKIQTYLAFRLHWCTLAGMSEIHQNIVVPFMLMWRVESSFEFKLAQSYGILLPHAYFQYRTQTATVLPCFKWQFVSSCFTYLIWRSIRMWCVLRSA